MSESGNLDLEDRSQLIAFCKAIRWSPRKREAPDLSCISVVPTPTVFWLCRIDETTDDKERLLAIRVTATGYDRSDSEAVQRIRAGLIDAGVEHDHIPDLITMNMPAILTHREMLHFERQPINVAPPVQPPPEAVSPPLTISLKQPAVLQKSRGQPMKSMLILLLGTIFGALCVWSAYVRPAHKDADRVKAINMELLARYQSAENNLQQWVNAAQIQDPGIMSAKQLSERIQAKKQELVDAQEKIKLFEKPLTEDDREMYDVVGKSKALATALDAASDAIKNLKQKLPSQQNTLDKAKDLAVDAWDKVSTQGR